MKINILDNGYVKLIESWGSGEAGIAEAGIIEAARQSTQGSFRGWEKDEKLLKFLYENKHSTPFEFCGMTIEVQIPFVAIREWHRHRTQSYNEMSGRYGTLPNISYLPKSDRLFFTQEHNIQSQGLKGIQLTEEGAKDWLARLEKFYKDVEDIYQYGLNLGIPKELSRIVLPLGRYTRMRSTANLRNWLHFLGLRMNPDAQYEIRMFANAVGEIIAQEFPKTWKLFEENK